VDLEQKINELFSKIDSLNKEVSELKKRNRYLENKIEKLEKKKPKKNSSNSSIPPSQDPNRIKPNQSLRKKTGKKSGGQKGHKGSTLKMHDKVDQVINHKIANCTCCGKQLGSEQQYIGKRQVVDIPEIKSIVTEHRIYSKKCMCGKINRSKYPQQASSPISYGNNIETMIGYLSVRQYMSMERISEFFGQVLHIKISQGTVSNKLESLAKKCLPMYKEIQKRILSSEVVGTDETGCVINGIKNWVWAWQNNKLTYISVSDTRGYRAITDNFPEGLPNSILVSDCWAAQLKTPSWKHQICLAHLQRELKYFIESQKSRWSRKYINLIYQALELKRKISYPISRIDKNKIKIIKAKSWRLLNQKLKVEATDKLHALRKRLLRLSESIWTFLDHQNVPPDNNGSERAIRNIKVKQKVSGQFRSDNGASQFAIIRSVIDTISKNDGNTFDCLSHITDLVPE